VLLYTSSNAFLCHNVQGKLLSRAPFEFTLIFSAAPSISIVDSANRNNKGKCDAVRRRRLGSQSLAMARTDASG